MAIYHLTAKTISRNSAASAKARNQYIDREGKYQKDANEVQYKESGNMPGWAKKSPTRYWQAADENERANGRLFKQVEFALPKELTPKEQIKLASNFCREIARTKDGALPYSLAIHRGHDRENPHCHLMVSERVNDGQSRSPETWFKRAGNSPRAGTRKTEELKPKDWLINIRRDWSRQANVALEQAGHENRIDHRSLKNQGINREPSTHLGPAAAAMERKGTQTDRGKEHRQSLAQPEQDTAQELQKARRTLENISTGISKARAGFAAYQAHQAAEKRRQKMERIRQAQEQARLEAEQKAQKQKMEQEQVRQKQEQIRLEAEQKALEQKKLREQERQQKTQEPKTHQHIRHRDRGGISR
jgi:hypothetical protein